MAYRQSVHNVLLDLADESESSVAFEAAVNGMFSDVNIVREQEWHSDLAHVSPTDDYPTQLESALAA